MKKLLLITFTALASHSMLAMEPTKQTNNATLSQADQLGKRLIACIAVGYVEEALSVIRNGANVNYIELDEKSNYYHSVLMTVAFGDQISREEQMLFARVLISHDADINLADYRGRNALWYVNQGARDNNNKISSFLLDAGINTSYLDPRDNKTTHKILKRCGEYGDNFLATKILVKATQLNDSERNSVKNWLLTEQRLRNDGNCIHKDLKKPIACKIMQSLAEDIKARVIDAGAKECRRLADENINLEIVALVDQYLDLEFLIKRVREQMRLA